MSKTIEQFNKELEAMELSGMDKAKIKSYAKDLYKSAYTAGTEKADEKEKETKENKQEEKQGKSVLELARSKRVIK